MIAHKPPFFASKFAPEMLVISIQPAISHCNFRCKRLNNFQRHSSREEHELPENLFNIVKSFQLVRI